ncbi:DUF1707 SHOCT-like domain-containing protein [Amycolatopsis circi]|uniref:DUF1707 SHOCT-like domain-containing protein n=1 Tax=Amycolatopsis circi TaxID=871959 RepID=UPI000E287C0E
MIGEKLVTAEDRVRCSDSEREKAAQALQTAAAEGRLPLAETEERTVAVYAARYREELQAALSELPRRIPAVAGGSRLAPGSHAVREAASGGPGVARRSAERPRQPAAPDCARCAGRARGCVPGIARRARHHGRRT